MPRTLPRKAARTALLVLAALLVSACVETSPAGPLVPLIPQDAMLAVLVDSPYKLFAAAEEFYKSAGISKAVGSDLAGLMTSNIPDAAEAEKSLDFARPWALALVPAEPGSKETRTLVYVPLRAAADKFLKGLGGDSMKLVASSRGYAVLATGEGQVAFPPAKTLDLGRLGRYPTASVKLWCDPNAIRLMTMDGFKPIAGAVRRYVSGQESGPAAALSAFEEAALSLLRELKTADAALVPGPAGITVRMGAQVRSGGDAEKYLVRAAQGPSALDWANQVDSRALYGYAWSFDPALAGELSTSLMAPLFSSLGLSGDLVKRMGALQARWSAVSGPRGAASLDMDMDIGAFKAMDSEDPAAIVEAMKKGLSIRMELLEEARDEAKYRELMRSMPKDPDLKAFMELYSKELGLGLEIRSVDKKEGSFSYGELGMSFKVTDPGKYGAFAGGGSEEAAAASQGLLEAIGSLLSFRWAVAPAAKGALPRVLMTTGDAKALQALAARAQAPNSLASDPAFAVFAKSLPPRTLVVGSLSTRRLATLLDKISRAEPGSSPLPDLDPARFNAWYSYLAVEGKPGAAGLEMGLFIPALDVEAIIELVMKASAKKNEQARL